MGEWSLLKGTKCVQDLCILACIWILFVIFLPSDLPAFSAILLDLLLVVCSGSTIFVLQSVARNVNLNNNVCKKYKKQAKYTVLSIKFGREKK